MNQAEQYSKNNRMQSEETCRLLKKYLDSDIWKQGKSILEVGTGDGKHTVDVLLPQLADDFERYVATDISKEMVEFASKKYSKDKYTKLEFMILDCQAENIPADLINVFDIAVSFFCFHWFTNPRKAMENIFSMLKPGGKVIAVFFPKNPLDDIYLNLSKHPRWGAYDHKKFVSIFFTSRNPENSWKNVFIEAGFVISKNYSEHNTVEYHDEFEDFFQALDPIFVKIPDDEKEAYLTDYFQEVKKGKAFTITEEEETGKRKVLLNFDIMFIQAMKPYN